MSVFFPKLSQSIHGVKNKNLPKEIIEQILFDLLLSVPYDMLLQYLRINKYCYELCNQTAFRELRYEINPNAKDSLVTLDTTNLINRLITRQYPSHAYGLFNGNVIAISLDKKYTDIYQRFGITKKELDDKYALQIVYHGPEKKITLRFTDGIRCSTPIDSEFPDDQLYNLLYRVVFFPDISIHLRGCIVAEEKFFRSK